MHWTQRGGCSPPDCTGARARRTAACAFLIPSGYAVSVCAHQAQAHSDAQRSWPARCPQLACGAYGHARCRQGRVLWNSSSSCGCLRQRGDVVRGRPRAHQGPQPAGARPGASGPGGQQRVVVPGAARQRRAGRALPGQPRRPARPPCSRTCAFNASICCQPDGCRKKARQVAPDAHGIKLTTLPIAWDAC
jgi:hypothetical protein